MSPSSRGPCPLALPRRAGLGAISELESPNVLVQGHKVGVRCRSESWRASAMVTNGVVGVAGSRPARVNFEIPMMSGQTVLCHPQTPPSFPLSPSFSLLLPPSSTSHYSFLFLHSTLHTRCLFRFLLPQCLSDIPLFSSLHPPPLPRPHTGPSLFLLLISIYYCSPLFIVQIRTLVSPLINIYDLLRVPFSLFPSTAVPFPPLPPL